jgi:amidase
MPVSRREFLGTAVGAAALAGLGSQALAAPFSGDLVWKTAGQIAQMIRDKQTTSVEVVKACYARIEEVNPKINAVVAICRERALAEAQLADEALAAGRILGPLHGVPFTVKDSFDTEGVVSTGGTLGRKGYVPGRHATVVARVRKAGAILLGKTNTPEFTLGGGARETYNLLFGQTYNPYNTAYLCSGSSGGAGAGYGGMTSEYNTTGWPAGVVRAGTSKDEPGLPLGIMAVAQPWRDDVVLAALSFIEGKTGGWQKPPI